MAQVCFTFHMDVPVGVPVIRDEKQIGTVLSTRKYGDQFAIYLEIPSSLIEEFHKPVSCGKN